MNRRPFSRVSEYHHRKGKWRKWHVVVRSGGRINASVLNWAKGQPVGAAQGRLLRSGIEVMMTAVMEEKDLYLERFARFEKGLKSEPAWLGKLRQSAIDRFAALGFPTLDDEAWRFTPLASLTGVPFVVGPGTGVEIASASLPKGVIFCRLGEALERHANLVEPYLARYADFEEHAFTALNTAFLQDGAFLYLPAGAVVEGPVEIHLRGREAGGPAAWHRRVLIVAERNSQATVVERYDGPADAVYFTSAVSEIVLGENAIVDHYKVQQEGLDAFHVHNIQVRQDRASVLSNHTVTLGGVLSRTEINAVLDAEGCECTLNGLYMGAGKQLVDHHTRIDHRKPRCDSHELYKGILDGQAHGVFTGKIYVHPDAQKTDAKQTNQTLLLSDDAMIDTKPQLEIYADDVKCTHGATVGQLDAAAIFYLRSRGIGLAEARSLLTFAFANDILGRIKVAPLRTELEELVVKMRHAGEGQS